MALSLHNSLTRKLDIFKPHDDNHVKMYVCGPTVYDNIHIGNARPLIVFDVLARLLRHQYDKVTYVRNITDIDDKIMERAAENGESITALTERTIVLFREAWTALGCLPPDHEPKATDHLEGIISLISVLIERGHAYEADGHVLFDVPSYKDYGRLSGRNRDEQIAGARVEVAGYKKDSADFILWKPSSDDQPGWDSPWGRGRPGWHIECSAMSTHFLGLPFDIHGGGLDLIFPHHENEIAQSCAAEPCETMANHWVHNGFVTANGEKMSKSLGNFFTVLDVLEKFPGEAIRFWMLGSHYRGPIDYSEDAMARAKQSLDRFYLTISKLPAASTGQTVPETVMTALEDDLNTPLALTELHALFREANKSDDPARKADLHGQILATGQLLGLLQSDPDVWLQGGSASDGDMSAADIDARVQERFKAKKAKNFALADAIRDELSALGIEIMDSAEGSRWRRR